MAENLSYWHDKDIKPYKKGENKSLDETVDKLTKCMVERVLKGEFDTKQNTSEV